MAITKSIFQPAPPGARPGAKAAGIGAPSVFNPILPPEAPGAGVDLATDFELPTYDWSNVVLGSGAGSNIPRSYYDALASARLSEADTAAGKLELELQKAQKDLDLKNLELARKAAGTAAAKKYYESQLAGVQGGQIPEALSTTLEEQRAAREKFANTTYQNLLNRLGTSYGQAQGLTDEGFAALKTYLEGAPQNAFVGAPRATATPVTNQLAQYMASRGVEAERAQPGLLAAQAAAEGGAANYNNLLNVLSATSAQAQQSRLNEQAMAQRLAQATLTAQKAASEGSLNQAQLAQLNAIQEQYNASRLQLQKDSIARENALRDAIATLEASGYGQLAGGTTGGEGGTTTGGTTTGGTTTGTTTGGTTTGGTTAGKPSNVNSPAVMALLNTAAAKRTDKPTAVTNRIYNFVEANPTATKAQVLKEFPNLQGLASLKAKKK